MLHFYCKPIINITNNYIVRQKLHSSNLFKKVNERSKELQVKQEEIAKKHNLLSIQYEELEHLKVNMNEYLGRDKTEKKKESVIGVIMKYHSEEKVKHTVKKEVSKEAER